jgi:hypothetical protein
LGTRANWTWPGIAVGLLLLGHAALAATPITGTLELLVDDYWTMRLEARDGQWEPVRRTRPPFTFVDHGYVAEHSGDASRLKLAVHLQKDNAKPPAFVFYDLELERSADGSYTGRYTARDIGAKSKTVKQEVGNETGAVADDVKDAGPKEGAANLTGTVTGKLLPAAVTRSREPVGPGEHPRLLLRKSDVAGLREKLKTPFGQAFLAKAKDSDDPVVLGALYQVTGEEKYATLAKKVVAGYADIDGNEALTGGWGHQIVKVALAFDLCHDGWPVEFRDDLRRQIKARLPKRQHYLLVGHANYSPQSNYYGPGFGSAAIASLLLYGDRGAAPAAPPAPLCVKDPDCRVAPATDYRPAAGVPVVAFKNDTLPKDWIYAGGFSPDREAAAIKSLGGLEHARPSVGDEVSDGKRSDRFRAVSKDPDRGYWNWRNQDVISVTAAIGRLYHTVSYFYTVIENDQPRWVEFVIGPDHEESEAWLGGERIEEGHVVRLEPGLYPLLVRVRIGQTEPWGQELIAPRFVERTAAQAQAVNARLAAQHADAVRFHQTELAEWKRRNGEDLEALRMYHKGHEQVYWHCRLGIGDGGFQAEVTHYGNIAATYPLLYAALHRTMFGRDVSPYPDATHVLPRQMMQTFFAKDGPPQVMDLNVKAHFGPGWCADYFPLVPEAYRAGVLWGWNYLAGKSGNVFDVVNGRHLAAAFVNYPLDLKPVPPDQSLPKTWAADGLGHYVFRSGWDGANEFIGQVFVKAQPIRAWNHPNAGTFRLWGLGRRWNAAPIERSGYRPEESILLLPDDVTNESACGRVARYEPKPNGSGTLTIDLNDVYLAARPKPVAKKSKDEQLVSDIEDVLRDTPQPDHGIGEATKTMPIPQQVVDYYREKDKSALLRTIPGLYNRYGGRLANVDKTSPITGSRAFAFDYSGTSGAPCLLVIADTVRGGTTKQWLWQLPDKDKNNYRVRVEGQTFTIAYPDAALRGTIVSPADARLEYKEDAKMSFIYRGGSAAGQLITRSFSLIAAETKAKEADFLVVITVQRGPPPEVKTQSDGVTVGSQPVRYRNGNIEIGQP